MDNPGRVLIRYGKHGNDRFFAEDPKEELAAYLALFRLMDDEGCYYDLDENQARWHAEAKEGNAQSARLLLEVRRNCEYEQIEFEKVHRPGTKYHNG